MPSTRNCTPTTATLSEAVAETVTAPETVLPEVGAVIETLGGVVSVGGGAPAEPNSNAPTSIADPTTTLGSASAGSTYCHCGVKLNVPALPGSTPALIAGDPETR